MNKIIRIISLFLFLTLVCGSQIAFAQDGQSDSSLQLQRQIQELLDKVQSLQQQLNAIRIELGVPETTSVSATVTPPELNRNLSRGSRGDDVRELQKFLAQDKEVYPDGLITGFFGPLTEAAVKKWQEKHDIESIGVIGPKTIAKFKEFTERESAATPAIPATPAEQGVTPAIPATPAVPPSPTHATSTPPTTVPPSPPPPTAPIPVSGQAIPAWVRLLGGSQSDQAWGIAKDNANNVYIVGDTYTALDGQFINGLDDALIAKYDTNGNRLWVRLLGSAVGDVFKAAAVDSSNNIYAVGLTYGSVDGLSNAGNTDALIAKYDSDGNKLWVREFGSNLNDQLYGVAVDSSGNVYAAGLTDTGLDGQAGYGSMDALLVKYDSSGNKLWTRLLGSYTYDRAEGSIGVDSSGNVYISGWTRAALIDQLSTGSDDAFIAKYDSAGKRLWIRQWGSADNDDALALAVGGGNIYAVGQTRSSIDLQPTKGDYDVFISKFDLNGNRLWTRQFGTAGFDKATAVAADSAGNAYVSGYVNGSLDGQTNAGASDAFVVKYDVDGNKIWTKLLGSDKEDISYGVSYDSAGNVYISGYTSGPLSGQFNAGQSDAFVAKYSLGSPTPTVTNTTTPTPTTTTTQTVTTPTPTTTTTQTVTTTTTTTTATTTAATDTTPPSVPINLNISIVSSSQINLSWAASTDNVGVAGYKVYRNGSYLTSVAVASYNDTNLSANSSYSYTVAAYDAAGNVSVQSLAVTGTTLATVITTATTTTVQDTTPPVISNLQVTNITSSSATVSWVTDEPSTSAIKYSTDPSMIAPRIKEFYDLVTSHSINLSDLTAGATYYYFVLSIDASNNHAYLPSTWPETKTFVTSAASPPSTATCSALTFGLQNNKTTYVLGESGYVTFSCLSPVYVCMRIIDPAGSMSGIGCHTATSGIDGFTPQSVGNYTARACYNATGVSDCPTTAASVPFTVVATSTSAVAPPSSLATLLESLISALQQLQKLLGR